MAKRKDNRQDGAGDELDSASDEQARLEAEAQQGNANEEAMTGGSDRVLGKGHGTGALGPSDSSDSGSDVLGGPGLVEDLGIGLDSGTTSDPDPTDFGGTAGPDVGDANLDSDSDAGGTGERATAGRDSALPEDRDLSVDRIERIDDGAETEQLRRSRSRRRSAG